MSVFDLFSLNQLNTILDASCFTPINPSGKQPDVEQLFFVMDELLFLNVMFINICYKFIHIDISTDKSGQSAFNNGSECFRKN